MWISPTNEEGVRTEDGREWGPPPPPLHPLMDPLILSTSYAIPVARVLVGVGLHPLHLILIQPPPLVPHAWCAYHPPPPSLSKMNVGVAGASQEMLRPYVAFQATLRSAYHAFVLKLEEDCKMLLNHQLQVRQGVLTRGVWWGRGTGEG